MKKLLLWFAFGASVCMVLLCLVIFGIRENGPAQPSASPSHPSAHLNSVNPTAAPVTVPEPSPKAVSFYHSTILLIAVIILWSLLIPVGFEGIHDLFADVQPIEELWQKWQQPEIWRLPHGHISGLFVPGLTGRVFDWPAPRLEAAQKNSACPSPRK